MDLVINKKISAEFIQEFFDLNFKYIGFNVLNCFSEVVNQEIPVVYRNTQGAYPIMLEFSINILENDDLMHQIAYQLSKRFNCKVWLSTPIHVLDDSPYWSSLYDNGIAYLVDDVAIENFNKISDKYIKIKEKIPYEKLPVSIRLLTK